MSVNALSSRGCTLTSVFLFSPCSLGNRALCAWFLHFCTNSSTDTPLTSVSSSPHRFLTPSSRMLDARSPLLAKSTGCPVSSRRSRCRTVTNFLGRIISGPRSCAPSRSQQQNDHSTTQDQRVAALAYADSTSARQSASCLEEGSLCDRMRCMRSSDTGGGEPGPGHASSRDI